MNLEFAGQI